MVFNYQAGDTDDSLRAALRRAIDAFLSSLGVLLVFFVYILPWMLMALAVLLGVRWVRRRVLAREAAEPAPAEPVTPTEA
jgi:hypothetical protein